MYDQGVLSMKMDAPLSPQEMDGGGCRGPARTVRLCYSICGISALAGVEDYTEGIYCGNPGEDFHEAQRRQHNYLLDELEAGPGFRLLEIGCGLGTLLATARERGIDAIGVTVSQDQSAVCSAKNLSVLCADYRELPRDWRGKFDGIIVNGALEHFCQPEDALDGSQDGIYSDMFRIFSFLLDPASSSRRLVTTALHFRGKPVTPDKFLKSPLLQLFDNAGFNFSILHRGYGGYYPAEGQLERCAKGNFVLIREVDGTQDYGFTAEDWLRKFRRALRDFRFGAALIRHLISNPIHTLWFAASFIGPASQLWQFRGRETPVRHYRHTWQAL
jgi:SAM-dependent methyltransferase